jgi:hypothetical protein
MVFGALHASLNARSDRVVAALDDRSIPVGTEASGRAGSGRPTCMSDQEKRPTPESEEPDGQEHGDSPPETESLEERAHASTDAQWIAEGEEEG